jgi:50S ribosomal protein L16 3-hydroxylase
MVRRVHGSLKKIRWNKESVGDFLGQYLSEPKPHVVFSPSAAISLERFHKSLMRTGLQLDLKTQALFHAKTFFINGERVTMQPGWTACLKSLADDRKLSAESLQHLDELLLAQLHQWYLAGYLHCA